MHVPLVRTHQQLERIGGKLRYTALDLTKAMPLGLTLQVEVIWIQQQQEEQIGQLRQVQK